MTRGQRSRSRLAWVIALALLVAALAATGAVAAKPKVIQVAWGSRLPELTYGTSVTVAPDGTPWFGVEYSSGPLLVSVREGQLATDYLQGERRAHPISITSEARFDSEGNLWFVKRHGRGPETIVRRAVDGSLSESSVPGRDWVDSLAIGPAGEAWFSIGGKAQRFGFIDPTGQVTRIPLPIGVFPRSLVAGPEGAIWFIDGPDSKVGRVTADGAVRLFPLGAGVGAGELVAGSDGALWFSENGRRGRDGKRAARIGRVTTSGKVTQFPIPFGHRTEKLAATPQGRIWFTTDEDELSSISTSGAIGPHGCIHFSCRKPIVGLAAGPDGSVWFAIAHVYEHCGGCGGGTNLLLQNEGAGVGQIAAPRSASVQARETDKSSQASTPRDPRLALAHLPRAKYAVSTELPWRSVGRSVAVSPEGVPWFGIESPEALSLASIREGALKVEDLDPGAPTEGERWGSTRSLSFDAEGNLWFVRSSPAGAAIVKRAPDGTETAFPLSGAIGAPAIGPEGDAWFATGHDRSPRLVSVSPTGQVTEHPLADRSAPRSIAAGPDGAIWFTEESAGKIGRLDPSGAIRTFRLGPGTEPSQIVAGSDGALWFSENGKRGPHKKSHARIGRITTAGKVTQFQVPFGGRTEVLAAQAGGPIWFTTADHEISSISATGALGGRSCLTNCHVPINDIAVTPEGAIWFAAAKWVEPCLECGGGTVISRQIRGTLVGEIAAGRLAPAE